MKILITGGRSGIGMALAERQLQFGNEVVVTASSEASAQAVRGLYTEKNLKVEVVVFALDPLLPWGKELDAILEVGVDALVVNASTPIRRFKLVHLYTPEEIRSALALNIEGNLRLIQRVLPRMLENQFGRLVFVSSAMAQAGTSRHGLYCLTKSGMEALFLNMAVEYGQKNVLANVVRPGIVRTERTRRFWKRAAYEDKARRLIPQGRLGEPAQIAEAFDALLSKTSYMTGSIVTVSGGLPLMNVAGVE